MSQFFSRAVNEKIKTGRNSKKLLVGSIKTQIIIITMQLQTRKFLLGVIEHWYQQYMKESKQLLYSPYKPIVVWLCPGFIPSKYTRYVVYSSCLLSFMYSW